MAKKEIIPVNDMTRTQAIDALRPYLGVTQYHRCIDMPTPVLKGLVTFYQNGGVHSQLPQFLSGERVTTFVMLERRPGRMNFDGVIPPKRK